jgi:hypothetical protein
LHVVLSLQGGGAVVALGAQGFACIFGSFESPWCAVLDLWRGGRSLRPV